MKKLNLGYKLFKMGSYIGPEGGFSEKEKNQLINEEMFYALPLEKRILNLIPSISSLFCIQSLIDKTSVLK